MRFLFLSILSLAFAAASKESQQQQPNHNLDQEVNLHHHHLSQSVFEDLVMDQADMKASDGRPRIAIIGGGAAGTSASYFLSKIELGGLKPHVTVFEATDRIGGRAKLFQVPVEGEDEKVNVEIGASIFVTVNKNLYDFSQSHNLSFAQPDADDEPPSPTNAPPVGIWDGTKFVYTASTVPWRTVVGALWRYGVVSTTRSRSLALKAGDDFGKNYPLGEKGELGFSTVEALLKALELDELVKVSAEAFLRSKGIGELYMREFIEAATRVNYGQNLNLNALAALVCLVAAFVPAEAVENGNQRIFEEMVKVSGADVLLGTPAVRIGKIDGVKGGSGFGKYWVTDLDGVERWFDAVIVAVPGNSAIERIEFVDIKKPRAIPFVHLHVTIVTGTLDPGFFGLQSNEILPSTILTCRPSLSSSIQPPFNSVAVKKVLKDGSTVTKIFNSGDKPLSEVFLRKMYKDIKRVDRFEWDSYPVLNPMDEMPEFILDGDESGGGIYHINAFEAAVSTMESETVSALNIIQLLEKRWKSGETLKAKL
ncbi:hypothetical protein HDU97_009492 [Phlyctochytrium planicorne]|nr:hypothetical protein HDU97_009492 [Phlyctochytrium planicorne]